MNTTLISLSGGAEKMFHRWFWQGSPDSPKKTPFQALLQDLESVAGGLAEGGRQNPGEPLTDSESTLLCELRWIIKAAKARDKET